MDSVFVSYFSQWIHFLHAILYYMVIDIKMSYANPAKASLNN